MSIAVEKLLTADEFAQRPKSRDGSREELVRGSIVVMPPRRFRQGVIQGNTFAILGEFVLPRRLGHLLATGVITERDPDTVRGPDIAFWHVDRLPLDQEPELYATIAPDLCVEILWPGQAMAYLMRRLREYTEAGVRMLWFVNPDERTVTVGTSLDRIRNLLDTDTIDGGDVLPGFSCPVAALFE